MSRRHEHGTHEYLDIEPNLEIIGEIIPRKDAGVVLGGIRLPQLLLSTSDVFAVLRPLYPIVSGFHAQEYANDVYIGRGLMLVVPDLTHPRGVPA